MKKRIWLLCLAGAMVLAGLVLLALLSAKELRPYTVEAGGRVFTVNPRKQTISDGTHSYRYDLDPWGSIGYQLRFHYPDGSYYHFDVYRRGDIRI